MFFGFHQLLGDLQGKRGPQIAWGGGLNFDLLATYHVFPLLQKFFLTFTQPQKKKTTPTYTHFEPGERILCENVSATPITCLAQIIIL